MKDSGMRPGAAWYFLPVLILLATVVLVTIGIVTSLAKGNSPAIQFAVPGQSEFEIPKAGSYVLWDETQTLYQGQTFSTSNQLPSGIRVRLFEIAAATNEVMMTPGMTSTMTVGRTVRHSVGNFEVAKSGRYRLVVEGQFPQRIFYFRESLFHGAAIILAGAGFLVLGLIASLVSAAIIFFNRRASARR